MESEDAELQKEIAEKSKLLKEFPELFNPNLDIAFMFRGLDIGIGWIPLVREMVVKLKAQALIEKRTSRNTLICAHIHEKRGYLSVCLINNSHAIQSIVNEYERRSAHICASCGAPRETLHRLSWLAERNNLILKEEKLKKGRIMNKVMFVSKTAAENAGGWSDWAVISITEDYKASLQDGWFAVCRQQFHDVDPEIGCGGAHVLMNTKHALSIVEFVNRVSPNVEGILVHCKGGISRSAAIAKWIAEKYGLPFVHRYESYNKHVYRLLQEADEVWVRSNQ